MSRVPPLNIVRSLDCTVPVSNSVAPLSTVIAPRLQLADVVPATTSNGAVIAPQPLIATLLWVFKIPVPEIAPPLLNDVTSPAPVRPLTTKSRLSDRTVPPSKFQLVKPFSTVPLAGPTVVES